MRLKIRSPFFRSIVVTGMIGSRYLSGLAKLYAYRYLQPPKVGKANYRKHSLVPRFEMPQGLHPEPYEAELRPVRIFRQILPGQFKVIKLFSSPKLSINDVYAEFGLNLEDLRCRSHDLVDRLVNGAFPIPLQPDPKNPKLLMRKISFSEFCSNDRCKLPDVTARFQRGKQGLKLREITVEDRSGGKHVYHPDSPADHWKMAQSILLGTWSYYGEIYHHVLHGHIDVEQYAVALHRTLGAKNPLFKILIPHVAGLGPVNAIADRTLIGPQGIFTMRDLLSPQSLEQFLFQEMKSLDWKTWAPMKPLGSYHRYARLSQLYWKVLTEFVDEYFECYREECLEHTGEIQAFSKELIAHCVRGEGGTPALSRVMSEDYEAMIDNLKLLCRYVIFKTTFAHSWVHLMRSETPCLYRQKFFEDPAHYFAFQESQEALQSLVPQVMVEYAAHNLTKTYMSDFYPSILRGDDYYGISDLLKVALEKYRNQFRALEFNIDFVMTGVH